MAKSKKQINKLKGHFFMAIGDGTVKTVYDDDDDKTILAAAFASAMLEDPYLSDIISAAFLTIIDNKEKYNSNKSKKPVKTAKKSLNKK
jgi:hypothetical protein